MLFEPGELHVVHAIEQTRLLLTLAPWPAPDHYQPEEHENPHELPAHATSHPSRHRLSRRVSRTETTRVAVFALPADTDSTSLVSARSGAWMRSR